MIGIVGDAATFVGFDLVLVDNPIEGRAIAETIAEGFGGNACQGEEIVVSETSVLPIWANYPLNPLPPNSHESSQIHLAECHPPKLACPSPS